MKWLDEFAKASSQTDRFVGNPNQTALLTAGLMGEVGSVLTELKKEARERDAYPWYRERMLEEVGDFLWYFVRLTSVIAPGVLAEFAESHPSPRKPEPSALLLSLELGSGVGDIVTIVTRGNGIHPVEELRPCLHQVWNTLLAVCEEVDLSLRKAADNNIKKTQSRWPSQPSYGELFDVDFPEEEQLPRHLDVEFRERASGDHKVVLLRCNGINFGDRLTDNIQDPDGYRYHDVFHFAHAVHLGWSPVVRALLHSKRKSISRVDEAEDGARAGILEEAVAAIVFNRAKQLKFFEGLNHLDYDLLKTVREFVQGYEVERIPLWQWEAAILSGYETFRELRSNNGGRVRLDLVKHQLTFVKP